MNQKSITKKASGTVGAVTDVRHSARKVNWSAVSGLETDEGNFAFRASVGGQEAKVDRINR